MSAAVADAARALLGARKRVAGRPDWFQVKAEHVEALRAALVEGEAFAAKRLPNPGSPNPEEQ